MAGVKKRSGGARPGAGRPRKPQPPAPKPPTASERFAMVLSEVRESAAAGNDEETILAVLGHRYRFTPASLKAAGHLADFRAAVQLGEQLGREELLRDIRTMSKKRKKNDGSTNIVALRARNQFGLRYDKQGVQDDQKPDLSGARERLRFELEKNALNQTARLGRPVTAADVIFQIGFGRWPWDPEQVA